MAVNFVEPNPESFAGSQREGSLGHLAGECPTQALPAGERSLERIKAMKKYLPHRFSRFFGSD